MTAPAPPAATELDATISAVLAVLTAPKPGHLAAPPLDRSAPGVLDDLVLDTNQVAALLKVRPETLRAWRSHGRGPAYFRLGGRGPARYTRPAVASWLLEMCLRHGSHTRAAGPVTRAPGPDLPTPEQADGAG